MDALPISLFKSPRVSLTTHDQLWIATISVVTFVGTVHKTANFRFLLLADISIGYLP